MAGSRSKFYFFNNMVCLIKALEKKKITVELRNNVLIEGYLEYVESTMNMNMSDVVLTTSKGISSHFSKFYVKGRQIMFVMIPEEVDIVKAMEWQLKKSDYLKDKERKNQQKTFQRIRTARAKTAEKLNRKGQH